MKKLLLSACVAALAMSASAFNLAQPSEANMTPVKMENVKQATPEIFNNFVKSVRANKAPHKVISQQSDLYKGYMQQGGSIDTRTTDYSGLTETVAPVLITPNAAGDSVVLTGMMPGTMKGVYDATENVIAIPNDQVVFTHSTYGDCILKSTFYYEGDETSQAGWYTYGAAYGEIDGDNISFEGQYLHMVILSGTYANYRLGDFYYPGTLYADGSVGRMDVVDLQSDNFVDATTPTEFYPVTLSQEGNVVTVGAFGGWYEPVDVVLAADRTLTVAPQQTWVSGNATYGDFSTAAADFSVQASTVSDYLLEDATIYGTATETELNLGSFMYYSTTGYWTGQAIYAATIHNFGEPFTFPVEEPALYILGEVNENSWAPNVGVEMLTEDGVNFTADVTLDGRNVEGNGAILNAAGDGVNYFSFTTKLAEDANDWDGIAQYRIGAITDDGSNYWITDDQLNQPLGLQSGSTAFRLPGGDYTFNVNLENMTLTVVKNSTTAISDINAANVAGVKYVNLAGQVSSKPFEGVNIVVTTLTDGTTQTSKAIK